MSTVVWVLVAIVYSGHIMNSHVPTMEFTTLEKCQAAIVAFKQDADGRTGSVNMRCVKVEK